MELVTIITWSDIVSQEFFNYCVDLYLHKYLNSSLFSSKESFPVTPYEKAVPNSHKALLILLPIHSHAKTVIFLSRSTFFNAFSFVFSIHGTFSNKAWACTCR